ncbi:MAG TPA: DUF2953 domain-containing protein [Bacillota bacterium]
MFELLLFLGTFCVFFFLPVEFRITFNNANWENTLKIELSFLKGLVKRQKEIRSAGQPQGTSNQEVIKQGRWFWLKKRSHRERTVEASRRVPLNGLNEFWDRYRRFGLGLTLLTYFLPAQYHKWLLVADHLENRGYFQSLQWSTQIGTGDSAQTAVLSGLLWAVKTTVTGWLQDKYRFVKQPEVMVYSDYETAGLNMAFNCIFRVKLGYIIIAAFIGRVRHSWRKGGVGD